MPLMCGSLGISHNALALNILRAWERSKVQILAAAQCFYKQVFGGNLKGAGSVRQDLPMYNLDLGNIAENKRSLKGD